MLVTLREPPNEITQLHAAEAARVVLAQVVQLREQAGAGLADDAKCCVPALQQLLPQGGLAPYTWPLETMPATIVVVVQHDGALHADDEVQEQRRAGLGHSYVVERLAARLEAPASTGRRGRGCGRHRCRVGVLRRVRGVAIACSRRVGVRRAVRDVHTACDHDCNCACVAYM